MRNNVQWRDSLMTGIFGPRGSGKSLLLTKICVDWAKTGRRVISNMPIKGKVWHRNKIVEIDTEPFQFVNFIAFDESLYDVLIAWDEINMMMDSSSHRSKVNQIINKLVQQMRHRRLTIAYTTQNFKWVDNRMRFQTDQMIMCKDMSLTPAGRELGLERGERVILSAYDLSGYLTGHPYNPKYDVPSVSCFHSKAAWKYYDTDNMIDPFAGFVDLDILKRKYIVDPNGVMQGSDMDEPEIGPEPDYGDMPMVGGMRLDDYAKGG